MTKARMEDVKDLLESNGWQLPDGDDLFSVENEKIRWHVTNRVTGASIELVFYLFGDLGQRTDRLGDILCCKIEGSETELYFKKRSSERWRSNLREFAERLSRIQTGKE